MSGNNFKVLFNNSIPRDQWNEFLSENPYASPFQTPEFYDLFNCVTKLSSLAIAIQDSNYLKALAVITLQKEPGIKGFFSRRAIIYGGPIFFENDSESLDSLLKAIKSHLKGKAIYIEIRNFFDFNYHNSSFIYAGFRYVPWLNYQIKTSNLDNLQSSMSRSRRRQIRKAFKQGVLLREANSIEEIKEFYKILYNLYRDKIRKPLFPNEFFIEIFKKDFGKYLFVYFKEKIIGGIMCPLMPGKAIYEYYVCGLDQEYKEQYPSVMATWAAIEYANQNGIPLFDFMGAGSPDKDYGVREFKSRFGGELVEHGRFLLVLNPFLYFLGKFGIKVLSKIKS